MIQVYFTEAFTRQRLSTTLNQFNSYEETWEAGTAFMGRKRPLTGDVRLSADKQTVYATDKIYCLPFDITEKDRIKDSQGNIYYIKEIINPMSMNHHLAIVVMKSDRDITQLTKNHYQAVREVVDEA